jgi:hypothetical protein
VISNIAILTRFPAEELLVAGKTYVRGVDLAELAPPPAAV